MPNYYETLFIVRPTADEAAVETAVAAIRDHVTAAGGEILYENVWGARKLAYAVQDFNEGIYVQVNFTAASTYPAQLERAFRLSEDVIRSVILRTDGPPPPPEEVPNYLGAGAESDSGRDGHGGFDDDAHGDSDDEPEYVGRRGDRSSGFDSSSDDS